MEKFNRTLRGYDPEEVNSFIDKIIEQFETMVSEMKIKDEKIKSFQKLDSELLSLRDKVEQSERMENTLKKAILMAEKTSEQIKSAAFQERDMILHDAKKSASRIVNEALLKAEVIEKEADRARKNINTCKRRLKDVVETQLELIDEIEKIDI